MLIMLNIILDVSYSSLSFSKNITQKYIVNIKITNFSPPENASRNHSLYIKFSNIFKTIFLLDCFEFI